MGEIKDPLLDLINAAQGNNKWHTWSRQRDAFYAWQRAAETLGLDVQRHQGMYVLYITNCGEPQRGALHVYLIDAGEPDGRIVLYGSCLGDQTWGQVSVEDAVTILGYLHKG